MNTEFSFAKPANTRESLTVSELNRSVAVLLNRSFPLVQVRGEISNLTRAASGHWYFSLKDPGAHVRCVMFRTRVLSLGGLAQTLREGDKVDIRATVSLYEPRGDFQLTVESLKKAGAGDLFQAFAELKNRLAQEGLFNPERKKPLPERVARVGVVTSLQAAALRDVLTTLRLRAPAVGVVIYPSSVQGADAPAMLASSVRQAGERSEVDVLLLVRGGGSIEDLWAFNDEQLARAIAACPIPTISGVGHETDFTICDFVADLRAATPTAAAIAAVPDQRQQLRALRSQAADLQRAMWRRWQSAEQALDFQARLLRSPTQQVAQDKQSLTQLGVRLGLAVSAQQANYRWRVSRAEQALAPRRLRQSAVLSQGQLSAVMQRLERSIGQQRIVAQRALEVVSARLELVNPLAILERGYVLVHQDGKVLKRAQDADPAKPAQAQFHDGLRDLRFN